MNVEQPTLNPYDSKHYFQACNMIRAEVDLKIKKLISQQNLSEAERARLNYYQVKYIGLTEELTFFQSEIDRRSSMQ